MNDEKLNTMTKDEMLEKAKKLATPINFEVLIDQGVLEKKGAWYQVLDMNRLPEHAKAQISEFSSDGKVKFSKNIKSAQKLVNKLSK
jgi:CRISPR/Cas system CSM-associated protein Csm5 (group 7 of RAMP superfamily)